MANGPEPLRILQVLNSTQQLYSGIGRNIFELATRLGDRAQLAFSIDDAASQNNEILRRFCAETGSELHLGRGRVQTYLDTVNIDLPSLLREPWDVVECVGWASAATNALVARHARDAIITYTPHYQPRWTVPMSEDQDHAVVLAHHEIMRRADIVFCDTAWEADLLRPLTSPNATVVHLPLGCDFDGFPLGPPSRKPQLLFVGDRRERRKRFDRVAEVFARLRAAFPELRLVVIGTHDTDSSLDAGASPSVTAIKDAVDVRGYVSEAELRAAYRESLALVLLSDYEAFGIPVIESLASGTPVFLNDIEPVRSAFAQVPGVEFCQADDVASTVDCIGRVLDDWSPVFDSIVAGRPEFKASFGWPALAERKWQALVGAWTLRAPRSYTARRTAAGARRAP